MSMIFETQKAIYAALTADSTMMTLVNSVYDYVPQDALYPYITIGDIAASDNSVLGVKGYSLDVILNVYSEQQGKAETLGVVERLKVLLDGQDLAITGFDHIYTKLVTVGSKRSLDNNSVATSVAFKIVIRAA